MDNLSKQELQDKCTELGIDFVDKDTKAELIEKINAADAGSNDADFDLESYTTTTTLTLDKARRKGGRLHEKEQEVLDKAKKKAMNNPGRKALKTNMYRVKSQTVLLVEGLPTPNSVVNLFSDYAKEKLFS